MPRRQVKSVALTYCNGSNTVMPPHLTGKLTYTFNQVLVRFPLSNDQLSHDWNHLEGVLIIHPTTYTFDQEIITGFEFLNCSKYINIFQVETTMLLLYVCHFSIIKLNLTAAINKGA
jgi:hypothetical protein